MEKKPKRVIANHVLALSNIVRNNADVRSRTIDNLKLIYAKENNKAIEEIHIVLLADRYVVIIDDLKQETRYTNKAFLNAFTDAFEKFSQYAAKVLDDYIEIEINKKNLPVGSENNK